MQLPGDLNAIYCPFCFQRLSARLRRLIGSNAALQSACRNAFALIPEVHEFDGLFELLAPADLPDAGATTCVDLDADGQESDVCVRLTADPEKVGAEFRAEPQILPLLLRDPAKSAFAEFLASKSDLLLELQHYLRSSNDDASCAADWLALRWLQANLLNLSLISAIHALCSQLRSTLRPLCLAVLSPLAQLLFELYKIRWRPLNPQLGEAFRAAVQFCELLGDWRQKDALQDALLHHARELVLLCYELLFPLYRDIRESPALHQALLERETGAKAAKAALSHAPARLERFQLLFENTTSEDIRALDAVKWGWARGVRSRDAPSVLVSQTHLKIIFEVLQKKQLLRFYHDFSAKYAPDEVLLNRMANRMYPNDYEESLANFCDRQLLEYQQRIFSLSSRVQKYLKVVSRFPRSS